MASQPTPPLRYPRNSRPLQAGYETLISGGVLEGGRLTSHNSWLMRVVEHFILKEHVCCCPFWR